LIMTLSCLSLRQLGYYPPIEEIYVVPVLGHLDYGFTEPQAEVKRKWPDIYRRGIELLESHPRARLTGGCLLPVEWFKEVADKKEWTKFEKLVRSGRWEVTAGWMHANTSVFSAAEGRRFFLPARRWANELGVPVYSWLHADVPGLTWNMAEAATDAGVKFIAVGANEMNGLSALPPGMPRLFRWEAPDGDRVLVSLRGGAGYMEGGMDLVLHEWEGLEERLDNYSKKLRKNGYPLDKALVLFSSGDNAGPGKLEELFDNVERWNESGRKPRIRITSLTDFYMSLTDEEKESLPVLRGDWPASGHWEALVRRSPHAQAFAAQARRKLLAAQLFAVVTENRRQQKNIAEAWKKLLLYDEHSGVGAWPGKMTFNEILEQNNHEVGLAEDALEAAENSLREMFYHPSMMKFFDVGARPLLACNMTGERKGGYIEWPHYKKYPTTRDFKGVSYLDGDVEGWSCSILSSDAVRFPGMEENTADTLVEIAENPLTIEPPLFIGGGMVKVRRSKRVRLNTGAYLLPDGRKVLTLKWGPAESLPPARGLRGWAADFKLKGAASGYKVGRGGLVISGSERFSGGASWKVADNGAVFRMCDKERLIISNTDGLPFLPSPPSGSDRLWWLLYVQEFPVETKDGEKKTAPNEPGYYDAPMETRWLEERVIGDVEVRDLRSRAMPIEAMVYPESKAKEDNIPEYAGTVFRTFETASENVVIEEVKYSDFSEGTVVVVLRNLSGKTLVTDITSNARAFADARLLDGLERPVGRLMCGNGWIRVVFRPLEVKVVGVKFKSSVAD